MTTKTREIIWSEYQDKMQVGVNFAIKNGVEPMVVAGHLQLLKIGLNQYVKKNTEGAN